MRLSIEQISEIIKMIGLVVAGIWAAWSFHKLQRARAAVLENEEKLTGIQKSQVEQEGLRRQLLRQQPQLAIKLDIIETGFLIEKGKNFLCITVVLKNEGEQNFEVSFAHDALTVGEIIFKKSGEQTMKIHRFGPSQFISSSDEVQFFSQRIFRVGQTRQMALAIIPITESGCYIVQFSADYGKIPFDGEEKTSHENPVPIRAIEQAIYFATGKPNKPDVPSPHST